jgi:nucleoside-diphosphate-sugar epimerase
MKRPTLVLGAGGFIGREIVAQLALSDTAVPVLGVRRAAGSSPSAFEQRVVDANNVESVAKALEGVVGVVNCVAGDAATIVGSAQALTDAARRMPNAPRIVHLSTMSVYGSATGLIDEDAPLRGDLGPYSSAKVAAEATAAAYPHSIILRPGCVFGPRSEQWTIRIAGLLDAHRLGDLGPAGDGWCNLVHVGDVARSALLALENSRAEGRAFNLSTPEPPTWNEFLSKYAQALGAVPVRRIPQRQLRIETKLLAPPLKVAEILGKKLKLDVRRFPQPIPPSLLRLMQQEIRLDTRRVQTELNLRFRGLDSMIEETARWFRQFQSNKA